MYDRPRTHVQVQPSVSSDRLTIS